MDLVHDLLDKKVIDRNGRDMGRVDGVILEGRAAQPPRVAAIEIGAATLFRRVRPFLGRWAAGLERALGIDEGRPVRIPFDAILGIADHVRVDAAVGETPADAVDRRLRAIVGSIPGVS